MVQPLHCPFCGAKPVEVLLNQDDGENTVIRCDNNATCPALVEVMAPERDRAVALWNTRVPTGRAQVTDSGRAALESGDDAVIDDPSITRDLILLLVERAEHAPSLAVVASWTKEQREAVEEYAAAAHANASDNPDVTVPPMPGVLHDALRAAQSDRMQGVDFGSMRRAGR